MKKERFYLVLRHSNDPLFRGYWAHWLYKNSIYSYSRLLFKALYEYRKTGLTFNPDRLPQ